MKPINEYRTTNVFCLTASTFRDAAKIMEFFDARRETVCSIAQSKEHGICCYTVRVNGERNNGDIYLVDYMVRTICGVQIIDQIDIV